MKINTISINDVNYPERLKPLGKAPAKIFIRGELPKYEIGVAIVGTRKPTSYGKQVTADLAQRLAERGAVIVSGLAHGIDGIAHEGALKANGKTIAVLACGVDTIYPSAHRGLADRILGDAGAIVSEYDPGTPPIQHRFLERNRIVSGLADIVIVTEASLRSGTMNTVSHALEQGKDVYALPGPITSAMSAGCNALIAQGAAPIVNVEEFVSQLFPATTSQQISFLAQNESEQVVLDLIANGIDDGDELHTKSALDGALFAQTMTMLEIRGAIRALGANRWGL